MITKSGNRIPVSLWIRQIDNDGRCLAVAETVERRVAQIIIDTNGEIVSADNEALMLFQLDSLEKFIGIEVSVLIPAIVLPDNHDGDIPKHIRKQKATGKTQDGISFPLCLMITAQENCLSSDVIESNLNFYTITIWVYSNLSGLIVIDENSIIESCNHHFSTLMFGYPKIIGQNIFKLIPNFGQEFEYIDTRSRRSSSVGNEESETETDHIFLGDPFSLQFNTMSSMTSSLTGSISNKKSDKICLDFTSPRQSIASAKTLNLENINVSLKNSTNFSDKNLATDQLDTKRVNATADVSDHHKIENENNSEIKSCSLSNCENNKNFINLNQILCSAPPPTSSIPTPSCESDHEYVDAEEGHEVECELLTPVNEVGNTVVSSSFSNKTPIEAQYLTGDILAGLQEDTNSCSNNVTIDSPAQANIVDKTPPQKRENNVNSANSKAIVTSTPDIVRKKSDIKIQLLMQHQQSFQQMQQFNFNYADGTYRGMGVHADGNIIDIVYTINKSQIGPTNQTIYCVWISRDPDSECNNVEDDDEDKQLNLTLTLNSFTSTVENSTGPGTNKGANNNNLDQSSAQRSLGGGNANQNSSRPNSVSLISQCEEEQVSGEYGKHYTTLKQIGKGAYGYVKMAYRHTDRLLVISKFILKEKLCPNFMVKTEDNREIPMEIYLLTHVKHPNIVTVLDVFENDKFFQLIMEKHGSGMDLFEFIDRRPLIDEKLGCYIFRQIAKAVDYLHSLNILHRDIKDENIIIDHNFHIKLIDFGSATFMQEGKLFSTFYGTTEYCSPEVLAGNKYQGPELEVWSLGVTLYVLMFFENPFLDVEDTLRADLLIPHEISKNLESLLLKMLDKDPKTRLTMKELMQNEWINQEITNSFNFAWIVPCEPYESNPEVYYSGQVYSSTTALSTSHDSLSLVDDDSMIQDEQKDEDGKSFATTPQQAQLPCDFAEIGSKGEFLLLLFQSEIMNF